MSTLIKSSDAAVRNGGSGIHIRSSSGATLSKSLAAGTLSNKYPAARTFLHESARLLGAETTDLQAVRKTMWGRGVQHRLHTDCKSDVQSLHSPREQLERDARHLL